MMKRFKRFFLFSIFVLHIDYLQSQVSVFNFNSSWKYAATGNTPGTTWTNPGFNDASWQTGNAELGYGDGDEATVVGYGGNDLSKYISTYFRKTVNIANASSFSSFTFKLKRDDGVVVYVNGTEVYRNNMPAGPVSSTTRATSAISGSAEFAVLTFSVPAALFFNGENTIAAEIHQRSSSDPDITFDLSLTGIASMAPVADAGPDKVITLPANTVTLTGSGTDADGTIASYNWSFVSGPSGAVITTPLEPVAEITNLMQGVYIFRLTVTDNAGVSASDDVQVNVNIAVIPPVVIFGLGSSWKYLDNGSNQGTQWTGSGFDDASWASGNAELGYGDGDEATIVGFGANSGAKYITTYFRKTVNIPDASSFTSFKMQVKRDDGVVIYVNGTEVYRNNMPTGNVAFTTRAVSAIIGSAEYALLNFEVPVNLFVNGNNIIAAEIHQRSSTDPDITFDLSLTATTSMVPVANAGPDQFISLPFNTATLHGSGTDPDGAIASYSWAQVSGPPGAIMTSPLTSSTNITGLIQGEYVFRLTVKDNSGISATDEVNVNVTLPVLPPSTLFGFGSSWKYLDDGSNQGTAWRSAGFTDAAWLTGNGEFGYGDGDETTVISYGADVNNKHITTYFRKQLNIADVTAYSSFTMQIKRDDGAVVYVNGKEVYRSNMPAGEITNTTYAASVTGGPDESNPLSVTLSTADFVNGSNIIAVEIHQSDPLSSDVTFDMSLTGSTGTAEQPNVIRGPYLQMGNQTAVTIKWRTDLPSRSRIYYGTVPGSFSSFADNPALVTEHSMRISNLIPGTKYYYGVATGTGLLASGNDYYFKTAPLPGSTKKIRIAAFGDCGKNENGFQSGALTAYRNYIGNNETDLWLLLGDNAYENGTENEYSSNFFNPYGNSILRNHMLFPSPGNHEYADNTDLAASKNIPYYSIFDVPANAECGGVASGNKSYYSFDYGPVHFISLDSYGTENGGTTHFYDTLGAQATWLKQDLAATEKKWIIAYWHHPPYTKGSHNSDTESDLIAIRQNFIRILERYGVDMVLCGHSHNYERSYLLKGHYGAANTFNASAHAASNSSGKYDNSSNSCPYILPQGKVEHGTVYVVAGSAGADGPVVSGEWPMQALPFAQDDGGAFYIEIEDNRLDAKFIRKDGIIADQFTIMKNVNKSSTVNISNGASATLIASYIGNYNWSGGTASGNTRSISVKPPDNSTVIYHARDNFNCLDDAFTVITGAGNAASPAGNSIAETERNGYKYGKAYVLTVANTFGEIRFKVNSYKNQKIQLRIIDITGRSYYNRNTAIAAGTIYSDQLSLRPGIYLLDVMNEKGERETRKIIVR
jgi:hypothetical protein